jgi:glycosyltransferase involved in cell wall biosynthesis/peptidoglycan/xylan/chitin deacetylase (PgdA/CDA1 family)
MFLNNLYYSLKPIMPWRLRLALRQWRADRRRNTFADAWPIDPRAGATPPGWPGWPNSKRFALVLTHDVEGNKGLARVESLMNLELDHGFHSSFNFVPEGEYCLPDALRRVLDRAGFEVGVHGLEHDGKLYHSKADFAAKVPRIMTYMRQWNASGFRSPLMQHDLGWLHALDMEYDGSTFDTDPFEPQPDGVGTIFPFWVPSPSNSGYVELPYTLVQDFTLFVILRERDINVWKRKLDWIAEHGGMALINTHPDYMCFEHNRPQRDEYPVSYYKEFLTYVREKYDGSYWAALPSEVNSYYRSCLPAESRNTRRKICMIAYTFYDSDNRVRRYAETLAKRGNQVDVIALSGARCQNPLDVINGVTVYRIQHREPNERHKWTYAWRLTRFLAKASRFVTKLHMRNRYDLIHIHNMPDFLVFAAWFPKLTGAKLILDIHDLVPELFDSKFTSRLKGVYVGLLKLIEKISMRLVHHVIVSNHLWYERLVARSVPSEKCSVFVNNVDPAIFYQRRRSRSDEKYIVLFPGSFQRHQGLDIAIEAFAHFKHRVPNAEFHLYGGGNGKMETVLKDLVRQLGLEESIRFCGDVSLDKIADVIANADLGVVPKRADSFGNEAYSTKIMEFMSQGVPVVASRTKIDTFYFEEGDVHFCPSGDSVAMAQAMMDVAEDKKLRDSLIARGRVYVERHGWNQKKKEYLDLVDSLATERFDNVHLTSRPVSALQR